MNTQNATNTDNRPSLKSLFIQKNEDGKIERKIPSVDELKAALEAGADVNEPIAVKYAIQSGQENLLKLFLKHGADVSGEKGLRYLIDAFLNYPKRRNYNEIIRLLLSHGANINERDSKQRTPLMRTVNPLFEGLEERLLLMLKYGADVNAQDEKGRTPLMYVLRTYNRRRKGNNAVPLLIENGTDLTLRDIYGFTASDYARFYEAPSDVRRCIDSAPQNPAGDTARNNHASGGNLLHRVLRPIWLDFMAQGNDDRDIKELMHRLITSGIEVNALDSKGCTPLMLATKRRFATNLTSLLLEYGADPTIRDANGFTALNYAQFNDASPEVLELLTPKD